MDAIFESSMNDMQRSIAVFGLYMEKASLQLDIELEEYVESVLNYNSSSSFVAMEEAKNSFFIKMKNAIKTLIERLKTFCQNTKKNMIKYSRDKKIEEKVKKIENVCKNHKLLQKIKINHKDFSARRKFIEREQEEFRKLFAKKTKGEEIRSRLNKTKESLKDNGLIKMILIPVVVFGSLSFFKGIKEGYEEEKWNKHQREFDESMKKITYAIEHPEEFYNSMKESVTKDFKKFFEDAENTKVEIEVDKERMTELNENIRAFMEAMSYLVMEEAKTYQDELEEYCNEISRIEQNRLFREEQIRQIEELNRIQQEQMLQQQIQMNSMLFAM